MPSKMAELLNRTINYTENRISASDSRDGSRPIDMLRAQSMHRHASNSLSHEGNDIKSEEMSWMVLTVGSVFAHTDVVDEAETVDGWVTVDEGTTVADLVVVVAVVDLRQMTSVMLMRRCGFAQPTASAKSREWI